MQFMNKHCIGVISLMLSGQKLALQVYNYRLHVVSTEWARCGFVLTDMSEPDDDYPGLNSRFSTLFLDSVTSTYETV